MPNLFDEVEVTSDPSAYGLRTGERGAALDITALSRGTVTVKFYRDDSVHLLPVTVMCVTDRAIAQHEHVVTPT